MNTVITDEPKIVAFKVTSTSLIADLADGRRISAPLAWSWRLSDAKPEQRSNFEIMGNGQGVHWPDLDEDISVHGMLHGIPARQPRKKHQIARQKLYKARKQNLAVV